MYTFSCCLIFFPILIVFRWALTLDPMQTVLATFFFFFFSFEQNSIEH